MKQKAQTKRKPTNADLIPPRDKRCRISKLEKMGAAKEVIKLRAQGWAISRIREWLNKNYPKPDGKGWDKGTINDFIYKRRDRVKEIASMDSSVVDQATKVAIDTMETLITVNKKLWSLLKRIEQEEDDSRQQVKTLHAIMRAIEIADRLQSKLPVAEKSSSESTLSHKEVIDMLVKDGILIVADKDRLTLFESSKK